MSLEIQMLSIDQLRPNPWNPNRMTEAEFQALVVEVERLGRVPKPIVVRRSNEDFEIVDGEHSWHAAQQLGLTDVACEIIEADDFEAMRQTFKRNQHGSHTPVREGHMFLRMREERQIGNRELASLVNVSEGTIRNRLLYLQAATMRNRYAGENRDAEINGLQVRQIHVYVDLPQPIGDLWLDAGAKLSLLGKYQGLDFRRVALSLERYAFVEFLEREDFRDSFVRLVELSEWLDQHPDVPNAIDYVLPIASRKLPSLLAWILPLRERGEVREICIDVKCWQSILEETYDLSGIAENFVFEAQCLLSDQLELLEIDPAEVYHGPITGLLETLLELPDFIRFASELSPAERVQLYFAEAPAPREILDQAQTETLELLREERAGSHPVDLADRRGPGYVLGVFLGQVRAGMEAAGHSIPPRNINRDAVLESFDRLFHFCPHLANATVGGRPVLDVFRQRIAELATPELVLLLNLFYRALPSVAMGVWMDAVHGEVVHHETSSEGPLEPSVPNSETEPLSDNDSD